MKNQVIKLVNKGGCNGVIKLYLSKNGRVGFNYANQQLIKFLRIVKLKRKSKHKYKPIINKSFIKSKGTILIPKGNL